MANDTGDIALGAWFPFYPGDFERDTKHLDAEEIGAYLGLLIHQWSHGSVPDDVQRLMRITKACEAATVEVVSTYFPGGVNPRLEKERVITRDKRQAAHEKSVKMNTARWGKSDDSPHSSGRGQSSKDGTGTQGKPESSESMQDSTEDSIVDSLQDASDIHGGVLDVSSPSPSPQPSPSPSSQPQPSLKTPPSAKPRVTDQMWEAFKSSYPKREGTQNWGEARQRANKLVKAHTDWSEIMLGVRRYADHISDAGKDGTQHVLQAATFLSPKRMQWTEHYQAAPNQNDVTRHNVASIQKFIGDNP